MAAWLARSALLPACVLLLGASGPPQGITPAHLTLHQALDQLSAAEGTAQALVRTIVEDDSLSAYGETGGMHEVWLGGDYRADTTIGPVLTAEGRSGGRYWRQNPNGYTIALSGVHGPIHVGTGGRAEEIAHADNACKLLGDVTTPVAAHVVECSHNGRPYWLFIDSAKHLVVRRETVSGDERYAETFDDFRATNGLVRPWHGHESGPHAINDMDWKVVSLRYNIDVAPSAVKMPPDRRQLMVLPPGTPSVEVPVRVVNGAIIVRTVINGRAIDLQVDSGASGVFLNRGLLEDLHLQTYGPYEDDGRGKMVHSFTTIPDIQIGPIHMRSVIAETLPWNYNPDEQTEVEGLIGYDLIAGSFMKLDYLAQTLTFADPNNNVVGPGLTGQTFVVPIALDDGVPAAGARVGKSVGPNFIVDTGDSFGIMIFRHFAKAHPDDVADEGAGKKLHYVAPFVSAFGVGGRVEITPTQVHAFHFGGVGFDDYVLFTTDRDDAFGALDYDGLIGWGFLEFFDIYFDYHHAQLLLQPNKLLLHGAAR